MMQFTALRKISLVLSSRKLRQPMMLEKVKYSLMLYLYEWSGDFEEGVLLFRFGSFGFHLTSLAAISLCPAPSYK